MLEGTVHIAEGEAKNGFALKHQSTPQDDHWYNTGMNGMGVNN